jgi:enamine deaminase RidA (YjgF/YER057c/UK114 family)
VAGSPSERLRELGLVLPPPPGPVGSYAPVVVEKDFAWVSGQVVTAGGSAVHPGTVDAQVSIPQARDLARLATLQGLSALAQALGSIDRVQRVVRVAVYVSISPGFERPHEVANGASDLLVEIFGEAGRPARVAMGVAGLPLGAPVEVELTVSVGPGA